MEKNTASEARRFLRLYIILYYDPDTLRRVRAEGLAVVRVGVRAGVRAGVGVAAHRSQTNS